VIRYEVRLPICDYLAGGARTVVAAPRETVHTLVTDFAHYSQFIKAFEASKVVGRDGTKTDVYLRVKILKGAAKIWAVVRFDPPVIDGDSETVNAHMVKGNVKRLDAIWHLHRVDDAHTQLALDLLIVPDLPLPEALVVPEVRDAAADAVTGVRDESEKRGTAN
jgi:ribosome-associated toxin RatA of RatAB toxin-antitoxin module